ncbi:RNA polymerase sigma factor [Pedobacter sp. BMA]|uniref:RNA polymerase sigma factor n=1 Tax=Pedobacter sp. BMA TaxID=1663685 RepID=UPI000658B40C|nr:sigma-70 family RNA polymerase sigma factor [Pedobacter sp. BMA]KLT66761.1 hypothetical protein AB669_06295 [Pedobacter sp. BMA]
MSALAGIIFNQPSSLILDNSLTDQQLWIRLLDGDMEALEGLYRRYAPSVFQYGSRLLYDSEAVRDCMQDVFEGFWLKRNKLPEVSNVRSFIIASFRNSAANYRLSKKRFKDTEVNDFDYFDLNFSVEAELIKKENQNEQTQRISKAMEQLTSRQKEIIYLKYFEELDYQEIAEILDLTIKGTYKLNARAIEALRMIMQIDKGLLMIYLIGISKSHIL